MIVAVVRDEYVSVLTDALARKGFGATKLASTGGFLKAGNTTFLIGVAAGQLEEALATVRAACPGKRPAAAAPTDDALVGGATVFVLDVERMVKV